MAKLTFFLAFFLSINSDSLKNLKLASLGLKFQGVGHKRSIKIPSKPVKLQFKVQTHQFIAQ